MNFRMKSPVTLFEIISIYIYIIYFKNDKIKNLLIFEIYPRESRISQDHRKRIVGSSALARYEHP